MGHTHNDPLVQGYLSYLREVRALAHRTVIDVTCTLNNVLKYMDHTYAALPLWELSLEAYVNWVGHERNTGKSAQSISKQLSHVRGMLEYAWRSGRTDRNVLEGFYLQDAKHRIRGRALTQDEAETLVNSLKRGTPRQRRDRTMVLMLYGCGLRTAELRGLNVQDIDRQEQQILVLKAKGGYERTVPVPGGVWTELLAYLSERSWRGGALFRTQVKRKRIDSREVAETVRMAAAEAGIPGTVTPRVLRRSFATHLRQAGVNEGVVARLMGHRSIRESDPYHRTTSEEMEAMAARHDMDDLEDDDEDINEEEDDQ